VAQDALAVFRRLSFCEHTFESDLCQGLRLIVEAEWLRQPLARPKRHSMAESIRPRDGLPQLTAKGLDMQNWVAALSIP
jgi:hypothetical protein